MKRIGLEEGVAEQLSWWSAHYNDMLQRNLLVFLLKEL
jgi:hypothetical protein